MKLRTYLHRNLALLLFCGVCALTVMWSWQSWRANAAPQNNQAGPSSPDGIWQSAGSAQVQNVTGMARTFQLRADTLERTLSRAPREYSAPLSASPVILSLPMPDGRFQRFQIEESPSLDPGLAARFPDIKSYRGAGLDDRTATMRFDCSPIGFHALVLTANSSINIRPVSQQNLTVYMSIVTQSETGEAICSAAPNAKPAGSPAPRQQVAIGPTRKNYRMAIATTGEYSLNYGGNPFNVANVVATLNTWLNLSNVIYERDLNAHFNLVNNTNIIFTDANTDGLTNTDQGVMIDEIGAILDAQVGNANYDIGHVLGLSSGAGEGGAGVASLFAVCADGVKGRGATRIKGAVGNSTALGVVAHEFGHQFSANHTFNGTLGNCGGGNRSSETSWETGSGNTLMSYNNTCAADNVTGGKDLRFHGGSYGEVQAWLATTTGGSCGAPVATGNTAPTIASGGNFTIPRRTPFTLTAVGGDADAQDVSALTYTWDELDVGGDNFPQDGTIASFDDGADPNNSTRPIFRALRASTSPARTFPNLTYILNNANIPPDLTDNLKTAEQLPRVGRLLNFRVLVRDGRGGVNEANAQLTVAPNTGPFELTAPNGGEALTGGNNVNVTWNVAGTSGAPINAANVKLSLSTDSGLTFPVVLAANTPNDGTQAVALPNGIVTTTARIKIEAVGNIFFDISDANFSLTPGDGCLAFSGLSPAVGNVGSNVTVQGINFNGVTAVRFGGNVTVNCPSANCTINSNTQLTATVPAGATSGPLTLVKTGCTDVQTSTFLVCPNPPTTLALDDDAVDTRTNEGDPSYYVNRLTPAAYPATLSQISVFYPGPGSGFAAGTSVTPTTPITVVAGSSTTGSPNNTVFQTLNTTVGQLDTFVNYQLPNPITITTGDFIVGFIADTPGLRPIAIDDTSNANRSYYSSNGSLFTAANGNYMIRGQVFTGNCGGGGGGNCPTVTGLNPPNGQVGANVTITGTNFAGITGVKFSNNVNATINNNTGTQLTVTVPAGAVTGPITISKTGCADVQTATFTVNAGCPTITITPTALNAGTVNTAYNQTLTADGGQAPYTFSLTAGNSIVNRFDGTGPLAIPDNTPAGADLPINVSGLTSSITKVTASVHLTHTYDQDLTLRLIGPDGTTINLAVKRGGDGDNYGTACAPDAQRTLFDDAAATAITAGAAPFVGSFKPEQALTAFNGKSGAAANGIWKLRVIDDADQDTGSIQCASIFITQTLPAPGLSLSSTGVLSGTPTTAGPFTFTVKATDNNNCMKTQEYTLTINAAGGNCPTVTGINPTNGAVGSQVVITGTNFTGVTGVKFSNNVTATINNNTGTQLTVTVPAGAVTGPITISKTSCADVQTASFTVNTTSNGGLQFYPLAKPIRLLDTRGGQGNCDNVAAPIAAGGSITTLARTTCEGITIPAAAQAIVGNITVINQSAQAGFLTLYPNGVPLPLAANMIYGPNGILANNFTVGLSANGEFNIFGERTIDVIVDVSGYFAPPGAGGLYYHPLSKPIRLTDTRPAQGNCDSVSTPIAAGTSLTTLARTTCEGLTIPAAAQAIVGNATVINQSGQTGYLTIYPDGVAAPLAANMVYFPGNILSNAFTVGLSNDGRFNIFGEKTIDMIVDVAGYYSTEANDVNGVGLLFNPLSRPLRILDTRAAQGNCDSVAAPIAGGTSISAPARLTCESLTIPATAQTVLGNVTVINQTAQAGFLTLYPDGVTLPLAANMIYFPGQVLSNAFVVGLNAGTGQYRIFAERTLDAIVDVSGYFAP